jgi:ElaB/YqjD/DUF883 family membrane-anchored ribosome-binding protein
MTDPVSGNNRASMESLSASAREAAATARARIGETYGQARGKVVDIAGSGRDLAQSGVAAGTRAAERSRTAIDKAVFSTRDLVAERPLTAIAAGIAAGVVLGFLANQLGKPKQRDDEIDESDSQGA